MDKSKFAINLQEITTREAKILPMTDRVAVFPIGSNEQHGPHLPCGTDTLILESVLYGVKERLTKDNQFIFLPIMPYGKSPEHMAFEGTISLKATTLIALLDDIVSSLQKHGVKKIVFLNSHGGNSSLLEAITYDFRSTYTVFVYCLNLWSENFFSSKEISEIFPELEYPEIHAASVETSLLMYLKPELDTIIPSEFKPIVPSSSINFGWATQDLSENGIIGDPRASNADKGKIIYNLLVEKTVLRLNEIACG
jgi:creatinine amidohydrolase